MQRYICKIKNADKKEGKPIYVKFDIMVKDGKVDCMTFHELQILADFFKLRNDDKLGERLTPVIKLLWLGAKVKEASPAGYYKNIVTVYTKGGTIASTVGNRLGKKVHMRIKPAQLEDINIDLKI